MQTQVHAVGLLEVIAPAHALMVLQLADDLDVFALLAQRLPDSLDVSGLTDERGEDHVNTLLHTKLQILQVLFRQSREVDSSSGQVDTLLAAQHAAILNLTHQVVVAFGDTNIFNIRPETNEQERLDSFCSYQLP